MHAVQYGSVLTVSGKGYLARLRDSSRWVTLPVALQRDFNIVSVQAQNTMVQVDVAMLLSIIGMEP
jgi:hypothetical protein